MYLYPPPPPPDPGPTVPSTPPVDPVVSHASIVGGVSLVAVVCFMMILSTSLGFSFVRTIVRKLFRGVR